MRAGLAVPEDLAVRAAVPRRRNVRSFVRKILKSVKVLVRRMAGRMAGKDSPEEARLMANFLEAAPLAVSFRAALRRDLKEREILVDRQNQIFRE